MEKKSFYDKLQGKENPRNKPVEEAFQRTYGNALIAFFFLCFFFSLFRLRGRFGIFHRSPEPHSCCPAGSGTRGDPAKPQQAPGWADRRDHGRADMLRGHGLPQRHGKRLLLDCGKRDQQLSKTATPETRLQLGSVPQLPAALRRYIGDKSFLPITRQFHGLRRSRRDTNCGPRTRSGCNSTIVKKGKQNATQKKSKIIQKNKQLPFDLTWFADEMDWEGEGGKVIQIHFIRFQLQICSEFTHTWVLTLDLSLWEGCSFVSIVLCNHWWPAF